MIQDKEFSVQYLPTGPRLERIFGTANLAKLVQAHGHSSGTSDQELSDIHSSLTWKAVYSEEGVFRGDNHGIAFGVCGGGVNPFSHLRRTYSMCPIVLSLLNLPRNNYTIQLWESFPSWNYSW